MEQTPSDDQTVSENRPAGPDTSTVGGGLAIGLALQLIQIPMIPLFFTWLFLGVSQLIYIGPAI